MCHSWIPRLTVLLTRFAPICLALLVLSLGLLLACSRPEAPPAAAPAFPSPTAGPTAAPTPTPTATAAPAPTVAPTTGAMPTPTAETTPTPPQPGPLTYTKLRNVPLLEWENPESAAAIRSLPWVADGIGPAEVEAVEALIYLAGEFPAIFEDLWEKPWLASGNARELELVLTALEDIAVVDGPAAGKLAGMPLLSRLEPPDQAALRSLSLLAERDLPAFRSVMAHPRLRDGIDDMEAMVVALLGE